jgi:ubiquinone/menaquinone biosynthesis C-methylase UbiE
MTTPQPTDTSKRDNRFVADPNSGETMAWLINADAILNRGMGGALGTDLSERLSRLYQERKAPVHILDIACGPGGWVIDVAGEHPEYEVTGVDIGQPMIDYARSLAKVHGYDNAHFSRMDVLKPLDFPDEAFDLVNARTLFGFMSPDTWPQLLGECLRITRPGGIIRLTELEAPVTTSLALNWLWDVASRSLFITERSFSRDGRHIGIIAVLKRLLREAGYRDVSHKGYAYDLADPEHREGFRQHWMIAFTLIQPFHISSGVTTEEEYTMHYQRMLAEMLADDFDGIWFYLSAIGTKG